MSETAELIAAPDSTVGFAISVLDQQLQFFRGSQDPRTTVVDFLKEEAARLHTDPTVLHPVPPSDPEQGIVTGTVQPICDYLLLILKIGQAMCDEVGREFLNDEVRVAQVRTSFDFRHWFVRVLFVIDADPDKELRFSQMANDLERMVLLSDSFAAEVDYVNKRYQDLDYDLVRDRYPFVAKVRVIT
jgi:hypothetical protein